MIGNGDAIFSGDRSQISVTFTEGTSFTIGANSLIVLRVIDGKIEIKIEKGKISGKLKKPTIVDIASAEEVIEFNSDHNSEFDLEYLPRFGFDVKKLTKTQEDNLAGVDEDNIKNSRPQRGTAQFAGQEGDLSPKKSQEAILPRRFRGFAIDEAPTLKASKYNMHTPYPANNTIVLHKSKVTLPIYPKPTCECDCQLDIYLSDQKYFSKEFSSHNVPIVYLSIAESVSGKLRWMMKDCEQAQSGDLDVLPYTDKNMADALKQKRPIEVMD